MAGHPRSQLVEEFTHPVRFSLIAMLDGVVKLDFATARDELEVSDSVLSRQASRLEAAGYVKIHKSFVGKKPATHYSLTAEGRKAWKGHIAALRAIAG